MCFLRSNQTIQPLRKNGRTVRIPKLAVLEPLQRDCRLSAPFWSNLKSVPTIWVFFIIFSFSTAFIPPKLLEQDGKIVPRRFGGSLPIRLPHYKEKKARLPKVAARIPARKAFSFVTNRSAVDDGKPETKNQTRRESYVRWYVFIYACFIIKNLAFYQYQMNE